MAEDSAIRQIGIVGNRIASPAQELAMRTFSEKNGISILAMIPFDLEVSENGITGAPVDEERSCAICEVARLAAALESGPQL